MYRKLLVVLLFTVIGFSNLFAQITAQEAIAQMGRGINMGNTLDARNYEGEWGNYAHEYLFDLYAEAGFTTVRIPITWNSHFDTISPYTIDADFLARVDSIIDWGLNRDLFVVINAHHDDWIKDNYLDNKDRFDTLWVHIADAFKDKSEKLFFEILNEPHGEITVEEVDELNARVHGIIREKNPTRIILYGGASWANSDHLLEAAIPDPDDPYLMGYYHSYDPWDFAGEGNGTWGTTSDKNAMISKMAGVQEWSNTNNIPVFIGEFGARTICDFDSRMIYYATYTEQALAHGMAFAVWDDNGWFQVLERDNSTWNDAKDILIYTTPQSPTDVMADLINEGEVDVSWTNRAEDADTLFLERRLNNGEFDLLAGLASDVSNYTDLSVEVRKTYYYRLIARYTDSVDVYSYPVKVYVAEDASDISEVKINSGIVFPNPATNILYLKNEDHDRDALIEIISMSGAKVLSGNVGQLENGLDISSFSKGVYFIYIHNKESIEKLRFLKM